MEKIEKSNEEWKKILARDVYHVTREGGTEPAFSGGEWDNHEEGMYLCSNCGAALFSSETKFDSGTGWPSFYKPHTKESVEREDDTRLGVARTEIHCARCGAHMGHVFPDGPEPTGMRYCINSLALNFQEGRVENKRNADKEKN